MPYDRKKLNQELETFDGDIDILDIYGTGFFWYESLSYQKSGVLDLGYHIGITIAVLMH